MKKSYLFILLGFLSLFLMVSCSDSTKVYQDVDEMIAELTPSVDMLTVEELHTWLDTGMVLLVDVREANEFNPGYIPGSVNIPRGLIEFKIAKDEFWENQFLYPPLKEETIVLICKKGHRSIMTVDAVKKLGFKNVKVLDGGFKKWEMTYPLIQEKNLDNLSHDDGAEVGGC